MQRHACHPRPDWREKVERIGLTFHSHEHGPYWDESAAYELTAREAGELESAANQLHHLCIDAAEAVIENNWWSRLSIPEAAIPSILKSWDRDDFSLYGRFDLSYDGVTPPKLLEYNADTPTALVEAAVAQWFWLEETHPGADQFNSIHERLIEAWKRWAGKTIHFSSLKENAEDEMTVLYLRDTCEQAGVKTKSVFVEDIGWSSRENCFVDLDGERIERGFKLYPWEWLWREEFSAHLKNDSIQFIEPTWKMLLSNKALLPILWELFPDHPHLLPAFESAEPLGQTYIRKPKLSREGCNVSWVEGGTAIEENDGFYGEEGFIYQAPASLPSFDGNHPIFGVWVIDHEAAGLGIREDTRRITGNLSRFVPHFFQMSFDNPTALRIGMAGELAGKNYRVLGRVVMSVTDNGETYFWNEFNLGTDGGENATLVYEETERGGEWRLFTMFEPEYPMTAADAATKRVGDPLNLDGTDVVVTVVDQSRTRFIQGQGPDDVEVGETAQYFNAEAGEIMQVVSWTGEEVEYYNGVNLASEVVRTAFNLPSEAPSRKFSAGSFAAGTDASMKGSSPFSGIGAKALLAFLGIALVFAGYSCLPRSKTVAIKKALADKAPLVVGGSVLAEGRKYQVAAHAVVEIAEVGLIHQRHEYALTDENGKPVLLVCEAESNAKDWTLFTPLSGSLSPAQAGTKKVGDTVNIDGVVVSVGHLFRSTIASVEGANAGDWTSGSVSYGFSGKSGAQSLLARWNSRSIIFYGGQSIAAKNVTPAVAGELEEKKK